MKYVVSPEYEVDIGPHVFPTTKYRLVRAKLINEGIATESDFIDPPPATKEQLCAVHSKELIQDLETLTPSERTLRSELPLTNKITRAYALAAGGTILASRMVLDSSQRICCHIGGGFHHAFANHAEGFCYINDIAVAIRAMQSEGRMQRAAVIDCDLHQGNGTAHIFLNDPNVFTFSMHQENNYPTKQRSDWDIGLDDFTGDEEYLALLGDAMEQILTEQHPQLVIYVAGADPYQDDQLGQLRLTLAGLAERDRIVLQSTVKANVPVVTVTAGGYARKLEDTVAIHAQTCKVANSLTDTLDRPSSQMQP